MLSAAQAKDILFASWKEFNDDQAPRLGAALAYYTILSLAPLLILLIALAGLIFGREAAQGQLFGELRNMVGSEGADAIQEMVKNASKPASGVIASILGFLTLIFGASSVAGELKTSLNQVWGRPVDPNESIADTVKNRSTALGVILAGGFLLLVSLAVSAALSAAGSFMTSALPVPEAVLQAVNILLSLLVISAVFAVLFKFLPDVHLEWRDVLTGAVFTAALFTVGKFLIGLYLGKASFGSTYGAAGSLVILLVWVYYSAQIFFFGAEVTQVYSSRFGSDPHGTRKPKKREVENQSGAKGALPSRAPAPAPETYQQPAIGAVGSVLGSALVLGKLARVFRRR